MSADLPKEDRVALASMSATLIFGFLSGVLFGATTGLGFGIAIGIVVMVLW